MEAIAQTPLNTHVPFGECAYALNSVRLMEFQAPLLKDGSTEPEKGPGGRVRTCARIHGDGPNGGLITPNQWPNGYVQITGEQHTAFLNWGIQVGLYRETTEDTAPRTAAAGKK